MMNLNLVSRYNCPPEISLKQQLLTLLLSAAHFPWFFTKKSISFLPPHSLENFPSLTSMFVLHLIVPSLLSCKSKSHFLFSGANPAFLLFETRNFSLLCSFFDHKLTTIDVPSRLLKFFGCTLLFNYSQISESERSTKARYRSLRFTNCT